MYLKKLKLVKFENIKKNYAGFFLTTLGLLCINFSSPA